MQKRTTQNCFIHTNSKGELRCGICENLFCSLCLTEERSVILCIDHKSLFIKSHWIVPFKVTCSEEESDLGLGLYQFKKLLWISKNIPTYLTFQYSYCSLKKAILTTMELNSLKKDKFFIERLWKERKSIPSHLSFL